MSSTLPDLVDPWRAVDTGAAYAGSLPLSRFPRLRDSLWSSGGEAAFRLRFSRDSEHRGVVHGEVRARLQLVCQRCMEPLNRDVDASFELALVRGLDEARGLPERYDPLMVSAEPIRPAELIEDELLLALPQIPMHLSGECKPQLPRENGAEEVRRSSETHPFAALADWKSRSDP